eukprot:5844290-Prymnesium_polylepis.1
MPSGALGSVYTSGPKPSVKSPDGRAWRAGARSARVGARRTRLGSSWVLSWAFELKGSGCRPRHGFGCLLCARTRDVRARRLRAVVAVVDLLARRLLDVQIDVRV